MQAASSPPWSRAELALLAGIVGVGLLLRAGAAALIPSPLESDYLGYWTMATNLYGGRGLADGNGEPTAFLNVGYPLFLWAVFGVLGPTVAAAKAANVVLGAATVLLAYLAARRLFGSWKIAALAAFFVAIYLEAVVYTAYLAKENLMNFLVMAQLALVAGPLGRRWPFGAALFGLAAGCMAMVGNAGLALLPALILQLVFVGGAVKAGRYAAVAAVFAGLSIAPLLWRNHEVFGAYTLNNNGGFNLYIGNNATSTPYFTDIPDTPIGGQWQGIRARLGERGADLLLREMAVQHILQHPGATLGLALRKGAAFWVPPIHSGKYAEGTAEKLVRLAWAAEFCAVCALFLLAFARFRIYARPLFVLWLLVASYTAVHMIFYVIYRYRLPIMPVLCIGAGVGARFILSWIGGRWRAPGRLGTASTGSVLPPA